MLFLAALLPLAGWGGPTRADTLIFDAFDTLASGANLNGRTPPVNNGNPWVATTATFTGNGAGGLNADTLQTKSASIDLGAGTLSNYPSNYTISADLTQPAGGTGLSWIALGLASGNDVNQNFFGNSGKPWVLYRSNGQVIIPDSISTFSATTGIRHQFVLQLDTRDFFWILRAFLDGAQLDLNGAASGNTLTYFTNPTGSHYAALATGADATGGTAIVDNFQVNGPLPEPGSALVMLSGLAITATRRRRR